jgi:phosphoglucosamine mutase
MPLEYFGTDGIRGTFGEPPLDIPTLRRLGFALAGWLSTRQPGKKLRLVAGRDPRLSGPAILAAVAEGLVAQGHEVLDVGIVPTPAVPGAILAWQADFGLMITASHNPPGDNGVKLFDNRGLKLEPSLEADIENFLNQVPVSVAPLAALTLPQADALDLFCAARTALLPANALSGWVIALDPGHGATCQTSPEVFRRLGARVFVRAGDLDGARINTAAGSEHPEHLAALVREHGARLGFAHDGDGDRLVACDESGALVDGDQVLGILALHALRQGRLSGGHVVATVQSNLGLDQAVAAAGGRVSRVSVGDRNVLHKLLELGASLGGENSGHFIFPAIACCGDGLLAALQLCRVVLETGQPLSQLAQAIPLLPQLSAGLRVREKIPFASLPRFSVALAAVEESLSGRGRVLARYSGTEKKLRLLVEGPDRAELASLLAALQSAAVHDLGPS